MKRIIAILAAALTVSLTACSNIDSNSAKNTNSNLQSSTNSTISESSSAPTSSTDNSSEQGSQKVRDTYDGLYNAYRDKGFSNKKEHCQVFLYPLCIDKIFQKKKLD